MKSQKISTHLAALLTILGLTTNSSCEKSIPTNVDIVTHLVVLDDQSRNLLSPDTPGFLKKEDIRIFYLKNGALEEVYHPNYTWPRNFDIIKNDLGEYAMILVPDEGTSNGEITSTIIKWNDSNQDTLKAQMIRFESNVSVTSISKIWFNDVLLYDGDVDGKSQWGTGFVDRLITVTK